ncbi:DNA adenine methylase [Haloarcula sp. Atlit-47R]|nr:DNA adenine methylase [Haloarcula sp. Atlit-47R]
MLTYDGIPWVLDRLPDQPQFIELFGDSVAISVARDPRGVDTISDPSNAMRSFFTAVRESESDLVEYLATHESKTILEREPRSERIDPEFDLLEDDRSAADISISDSEEPPTQLIQQAAAVFVRAGGLQPSTDLATTPGRWAFHIERPGSLSRPTDHEELVCRVHDVVDRLRRIQIEHEPFDDVIDRHDDDEALFFGSVPPAIEGTETGEQCLSELTGIDADVALLTTDWNPSILTNSEDWRTVPVPDGVTFPGKDSPDKLYCNFDIEPAERTYGEYSAGVAGRSTQVGITQFSDDNDQTETHAIPTPPENSASIRGGKILPFRWYGGKFTHLSWILDLLPESETFVEPFGGSGAVMLNRHPSPTEVYNDIDKEVVGFLRLLKGTDPESDDDPIEQVRTAELLRKISLSPFSRAELAFAVAKQDSNSESPPLERARRFFIRAGQTRSGLAQEASAGRWAYCKSTSRRTMSGAVSRWHGRLDHLYRVSERLRDVKICNEDAKEIIQEYGDNPETLIYCDPPYPHATRGDTNSYGFEMDEQQHRELASVLKECDAKVALSSYKSDLYRELYEDDGWYRYDSEEQTMHTTKDTRVESVWMNYKPPQVPEEELYKAD